MRLALLTYFDLGCSFGLDDSALASSADQPVRLPVTSGLMNPLGEGRRLDLCALDPQLLPLWRATAARLLASASGEASDAAGAAPVADTYTDAGRARAWLLDAEFPAIEAVVYGAGVATLRLQVTTSLPPALVDRVAHALEYAGYDALVSNAVLQATLRGVADLAGPGTAAIRALTRRPPPVRVVSEMDGDSGQSSLFTSFTSVQLCVDPADRPDALFRRLLGVRDPSAATAALHILDDARLWFDWSGLVLAPGDRAGAYSGGGAAGLRQLALPLRLVEISLSFLAAIEAMERLSRAELARRIGDHAGDIDSARTVRDSNRLRTFVTALASQCDYLAAAAAEAYQQFFARFERHAGLRGRVAQIRHRIDVLHEVQLEDARADDNERQDRLNWFVLALTVFTVASVVADVYGYLREDQHLLPGWSYRFALLLSVLATVLLAMIWQLRRRR